MKKLLYLMVTGAFLLTSCSKEMDEKFVQETTTQINEYNKQELFEYTEIDSKQKVESFLRFLSGDNYKTSKEFEDLESNKASWLIEATANYSRPKWFEQSNDVLITKEFSIQNYALNEEAYISGVNLSAAYKTIDSWINQEEVALSKKTRIVDSKVTFVDETQTIIEISVILGNQLTQLSDWPTSQVYFVQAVEMIEDEINVSVGQGWNSNVTLLTNGSYVFTADFAYQNYGCQDCLYDNYVNGFFQPTDFPHYYQRNKDISFLLIDEYEQAVYPAAYGLEIKSVDLTTGTVPGIPGNYKEFLDLLIAGRQNSY